MKTELLTRIADTFSPTDKRVELLDLEESGRPWADYLLSNPAADIGAHPAWGAVFGEAYGLTSMLLIVKEQERIVGGVPLVYFDNRFTGKALISMPYLLYGGILADTDEVRAMLLAECRNLMQVAGCDYVELRNLCDTPENASDKAVQDRVTFWLDVTRPADEIFASFKKQLRTRLRRADEVGLERRSGDAVLDDFHHLYCLAMREHGTPPKSKAFFAAVRRHLKEHTDVFVAYKDGVPVGGKFGFRYKDRVTMEWGAFPDRHKHLLANYMLTWKLIQEEAAGPTQVIDFGRSPLKSGGYNYKRNWTEDQRQITTDYLAADVAKIPLLKPSNPKFRLAIAVWKRLPLWLTVAAGRKLAKYLTT